MVGARVAAAIRESRKEDKKRYHFIFIRVMAAQKGGVALFSRTRKVSRKARKEMACSV